MNVLLVTPVSQGSGETVTALHLGESLAARGHRVGFLASPFAERMLAPRFPGMVRVLGDDGAANRRLWDAALRELRPGAVVFADYALFGLPAGCAPLFEEPGWAASLEAVDAALFTLDHFGWRYGDVAQLGPPHLGFGAVRLPPLPERMEVLLPCPMHEPGPVEGRRGEPFRYWTRLPLGVDGETRRATRRRWMGGDGGLLVVHSVPNWAWRLAEALNLPLYRYLTELLDLYLGDLPVTLVSVNNGSLLHPVPGGRLRVVNLPPLPPADFERLLFSADLVLTENRVSIAMGKAACGLRPCAALRNGCRLLELAATTEGRVGEIVQEMERVRLGAVYPFDVYPNIRPEDLEEIGLYRGSSLPSAFRSIELFGGEASRAALQRLLTDEEERSALRECQREYVRRLSGAPEGADLVEERAAPRRRAA